jgi:hypothetical protein
MGEPMTETRKRRVVRHVQMHRRRYTIAARADWSE